MIHQHFKQYSNIMHEGLQTEVLTGALSCRYILRPYAVFDGADINSDAGGGEPLSAMLLQLIYLGFSYQHTQVCLSRDGSLCRTLGDERLAPKMWGWISN
jgi:hypothetical protein